MMANLCQFTDDIVGLRI